MTTPPAAVVADSWVDRAKASYARAVAVARLNVAGLDADGRSFMAEHITKAGFRIVPDRQQPAMWLINRT